MAHDSSFAEYAKMDEKTLLKSLHTRLTGLSQTEHQERIREYGKNVLAEEKKLGILFEFLTNFKNPLVLILLFAAVTSYVLGNVVDGTIITLIVFASAFLNFFQEHQATKAAHKLQEHVATRATVIRDGEKKEIKIATIVPGDIIFLSSGDLVPADARILTANDFFVNQSSLTGESFPVEKDGETIRKQTSSIADMTNIVFFGTNVITGSATAVVLKTGSSTEFGKIAEKISEAPVESEFTKSIRSFSYLIMRTTIFFVLFIFFFNTFFKHASVFESFTFAIAIAVGLTPELLPMIMSVTMSRGSVNMAKKGVIVKKLSAIPNFGSMNILCTDKTGTLTEDKIALVKYTDVFGNDSEKVLLHAYLNSSFQTGIKNPLDDAIMNYKKLGEHGYKKIDEIPFDFVRKKMSIVVSKDKKHFLITKGAPEEVFKSSTSYHGKEKKVSLDHHAKEKITEKYKAFSRDGYRVLAVAIKELNLHKKTYAKEDEKDMELLGFVAFLDPAKQGVKETLEELEVMGIEVKVITGDNELVTKKICEKVGLPVKGVVLGTHIESLTHDALRIVAEKNTIFARFSPEQKNRIIHALKDHNNVVGYMGDGINDAPSLKTADVGISVSNAVDVAKESADMILTHKSLRELQDGVLEGRKTFGNTMKYIMMGISSNFGNMFSVLGAVLFIPFLPMLPIQILLNNFIYDISQITIPTDNVDTEYISKPKRWNMKFIRNFMIVIGSISSLYDFLTFFLLYKVFQATPALFQTGWFLESLATQTLVIYVIRTRKFPFLESAPSKYLFLTTFLAVVLAWILPYTIIGTFFSFQVLPLHVLLTLLVVILMYLISAELGLRLFYKKYEA